MAAIIDVEQCAGLRNKAVLLYATSEPGEAIPGSLVLDPREQVEDPREYFERVGISDDTPVVVYGEMAAYVWWLAKVAGLGNVAVLDGGMTAWKASGRKPGELGEPKRRGTITLDVAWERIAEKPESDGYVTTVEVDEALAAGLVDAAGYYSDDPRAEIERWAGSARALIFQGTHACVGALAATVAGYGDVRVLL